jgi:DNA-binding NarL/FixJ family response regulator
VEEKDVERSTPLFEPLTPRQLDILRLVAQGQTSREIAQELILSPGTVRTHVQRIIAKLRARDRTTAVVQAIQLGIISSKPED